MDYVFQRESPLVWLGKRNKAVRVRVGGWTGQEREIRPFAGLDLETGHGMYLGLLIMDEPDNLPDGCDIATTRVFPGPAHPLAAARAVRMLEHVREFEPHTMSVAYQLALGQEPNNANLAAETIITIGQANYDRAQRWRHPEVLDALRDIGRVYPIDPHCIRELQRLGLLEVPKPSAPTLRHLRFKPIAG